MSADAAKGVEVNVLVDDEHIDSIEDVAADLGRAGLSVRRTMPTTGVVTGSLQNRDDTETLRRVAGVASVEVAREIELPPPDAPVQ